MNKQDIFHDLKKHQQTIKNLGVSRLGIFGSFQRGEELPNSDVDILVIFEPCHKNFRNFMDLCFFLEGIFGREVDLLTPESLSQHFGQEILKEVEYVSLS